MSEQSREVPEALITERTESFPCRACGGQLVYEPGTCDMQCMYCAAREPIPPSAERIDALDFASHAGQDGAVISGAEVRVVTCTGCGAQLSLPAHVTARSCAFCSTPLVLSESRRLHLIRPQALLPFGITAPAAQKSFRDWLGGLWFAPSSLKQVARQEGSLQGVYIPCWTYACDTEARYRGERGEDREERYIDGGGKVQSRTVTDWYPASGTVGGRFDDVLSIASQSLPHDCAEQLEPWDLEQLVPYQAQYLSGFSAEAYRVSLEEGFALACQRMRPGIESAVRSEIGGDHQRIHDLRVRHFNTTFKHLLLPIWISAYRFEGRVFRFLVNARSGEVQGERPWSIWKISALLLLALMLLAWFVMAQQAAT